ncbi:nitroreductase family protein [Microbacterium sp. NPDC058345]|uniref:nitroreductase family protein n=1 Tax=Microbacterium sp. NPDC058345 TaxID=3346455 RepID=UPI00364E0C2B
MDLDYLKNKHLTRYFDATRKIPNDTVDSFLTFLHTLPTSVNIQPNHFYVLETAEGKKKLVDALKGRFSDNAGKVASASHAIVVTTRTDVSDEHLQTVNAKERADLRFPDPKIQAGWETGTKDFLRIQTERDGLLKHWMEKQTYLITGASMMAAHEFGFDATPFEGFAPEQVDEAFGLTGTGYTTTLLLVMGYPDESRAYKGPISRLEQHNVFTRL